MQCRDPAAFQPAAQRVKWGSVINGNFQMPVLKKVRHEMFCLEVAKGISAPKAYKLAGYRPNDSHASRLLSRRQIADRVAQLLELVGSRTVEITAVTAASATQRLLTIADKAEALVTSSGYSVARQAIMDVAKLNGLIVERSQSVEPNPFDLMSATDREILIEAMKSELARRH